MAGGAGVIALVPEFPPNYADIVAAIPAVAGMRPIFAWGDLVYNPHGLAVDAHLLAHESVHGGQHAAEGGPAAWWALYLADPEFRVRQEVEAYRRQLASFAATTRDRERRHGYCWGLAGHLSSPLYGGLLTRQRAYALISRR